MTLADLGGGFIQAGAGAVQRTVEDKNIELGVVASPTDVTADGGGISLKGTTSIGVIKTVSRTPDVWKSFGPLSS